MSVSDLVKKLESIGVKLSVSGEQLKYSAPKGTITPEHLALMKQHKEELVNHYKQKIHLSQVSSVSLPVPCSSPQRRILASHWLTQGKPVYNEQLVLRLTGEVNQKALEYAFNSLLESHEVLRLAPDQNGLLKHNSEARFSLSEVLIDNESDSMLQQYLHDHHNQQFEIESDLLLRACLFHSAEHESFLSIVTHHFIGDAWSEQLMLEELKSGYENYINNRKELQDLPSIQYKDFCQWQSDAVYLGCYDDAIQRACQRLCEAPQVHSLPLARPRGAMQTFHGASINKLATAELRQSVQAFCVKHKLTEFVFLSACYTLLLSKYSDDEHLCIGVPVAGRARPEFENLIGMFSNNIVLNYNFNSNESFTNYLSRYNQMVLTVLEDQFAPFELLIEALPSERSLSFSPVFQLMFAYRDYASADMHWHELDVQKVQGDHEIAKYDLFLAVDLEENKYNFQWQFNTDLFDAQTVSRWSNELLELIQLVLKYEHEPIAQYQLKSADNSVIVAEVEKQHRSATLEQLILGCTDRNSRDALISNEQSISYGELASLVDTISLNLVKQKVKKGAKVAVALPRSYYQVPIMLALFRLGAIYVPIDISLPAKRINYILEDSESTAIVSHGINVNSSATWDIELSTLLSEQSGAAKIVIQQETDLPAYIMYTSGTTGRPKGVQLSQRALVNQLLGCCSRLGLSEKTRLLATTSFSFDMSLVELFTPLLIGGAVIVANDEQARYPEDTLSALTRYGVNVYQSTPSRVQLLLEAGWQPSENLTLICGGEPLLPKLSTVLLNKVGRLFNGYGPTEICVYAMLKELKKDTAKEALGQLHAPLPNYGMCILKNQKIVPQGGQGELGVFGTGLADEYLNQPELTNCKFQSVAIHGQTHRVYMTGDLVRQSECGGLQFLGRVDNQVKLLGYRIELDEIINASDAIAGVKAAHACLINNQQSTELALFIQQETSQSLDRGSIFQALGELLPSYMMPSEIHIVPEVPTNANGKADWTQVVTDFQQQVPSQQVYLPMAGEVSQLMELWTVGLGMRAIEPDVSFFKSGGDSLVLMRLLREINQCFGLELSVKDIYDSPTVNKLSALISEEKNKKKIIKEVVLEDESNEMEGLWI
ncbi:condensation domain-containing protein [Pseudoalteromonas rhizosphaerae]|uniref:Condensation domain-containing protein n=1 Tax=Pseudoalteromonas rhizosphaerae TaxID=2518973 RepID=A0ABW8L3V3_9GAMM